MAENSGLTLTIQINGSGNAAQVLRDVQREAERVTSRATGATGAMRGQAAVAREVTAQTTSWTQAISSGAVTKFGGSLLKIASGFFAVDTAISIAMSGVSTILSWFEQC